MSAGECQRGPNSVLGKDVPVHGTSAPVESEPQGLLDVLMAPIAGLYDPSSYTANAIDASLFVLIVVGFLGVMTATGVIHTGVAQAGGSREMDDYDGAFCRRWENLWHGRRNVDILRPVDLQHGCRRV